MFSWSRYGANILRLVHDLMIVSVVAILISAYKIYFDGTSLLPEILAGLFIIPILYFLLSFAFNFKTTNFITQSISFLFITTLSYFLCDRAGLPKESNFLFHSVSFLLLVTPRFYLNLNKNSNSLMAKYGLKNKDSILIVGGAGYIGTHLIDILLKKNYSVRVLDRLVYGSGAVDSFKKNPKFELIEGDATEISKLVAAVSDCSAVVHLGGLVGDPACSVDMDYTRQANVIATRMVKEAAESAGVAKFVFASSCSVYGANDNVVNEDSNLNPVSLYAKTKIDSEVELLENKNSKMKPTILRFATVFGDSRRPRFDLVVNLFTAQAFRDKRITVMGSDQWRPFIHCRDIARAIEMVLSAPSEKVGHKIFNVGDDKLNTTIGEVGNLVSKIAKEKNAPIEVAINDEIDDPRNYRVSFDKIKTELGFEAEFDMETGIKEIYNRFLEGNYSDYKLKQYSNLEITKDQVNLFKDPKNTTQIYRPINEPLVRRG